MKTSFFIIVIALFSALTVQAQTKATQDNGQFVSVTQTKATTGKNNPTHYKLTNNNSVSMDFSLYKQMTNGSWDVTHHLDLAPGQTYEDITGFTGYSGKYVVYSAPHSGYASFPNSSDIAGLQSGNASVPPAPTLPPAPDQPATTPAASTTTTVPAAKTSTASPTIPATTPAYNPPPTDYPPKPTAPRP